jgi:hypothetical protein
MAARTFLAARAPLFGHGQPFTVVLVSKLLHRPHLWSPPPIVISSGSIHPDFDVDRMQIVQFGAP